MEIIVNIALRKHPGMQTEPVADIRIQDVYAKGESDVFNEIVEQVEEAVDQAYNDLGLS